jgi:hypothetical protein
MERVRSQEHQATASHEIERAAAERLRHLEKSVEQGPERKRSVEAARERLKQAERQVSGQEAVRRPEPVMLRPLLTKAANYRQTMQSLQHRMKPVSRRFSKLIHTPVIETTSEVIGKTLLRPSVSMGATTFAVATTSVLYLYARYYGFVLHGSEIWISLIAGGVIGLLGEALYKAVRRMTGRL